MSRRSTSGLNMLDPALCERELMEWISIKSLLSQWLETPPLVIGTFLVFLVGSILLFRSKTRRVLVSLNLIPLSLYCLALLPPVVSLAEQGLIHWIPPDQGQVADAIVILGRGSPLTPSRVQAGVKLWRAERASLIFVSGLGDAPVIARQLVKQGIPSQSVQSEECSQTTAENAQFTAMVLKPQGVKRILLITDPPHMIRASLTFEGFGFEVISYPSQATPSETPLTVYREYFGLISYGLLGRFNPRSHSSQIQRETL